MKKKSALQRRDAAVNPWKDFADLRKKHLRIANSIDEMTDRLKEELEEATNNLIKNSVGKGGKKKTKAEVNDEDNGVNSAIRQS
jgi:hypothetical protein